MWFLFDHTFKQTPFTNKQVEFFFSKKKKLYRINKFGADCGELLILINCWPSYLSNSLLMGASIDFIGMGGGEITFPNLNSLNFLRSYIIYLWVIIYVHNLIFLLYLFINYQSLIYIFTQEEIRSEENLNPCVIKFYN